MMSQENTNQRYEQRGVSSSKVDVHKAVAKLDRGLVPGAFCKVMPDLAGDPDFATIKHADGAGTKTSLAYVYWKETGDLSVWRGVAQCSIVMNLDDVYCAGLPNQMLLDSTINRNKRLVPGEVISEIIAGTEQFLDRLRSYGIPINFAGGETADVGDLVRTVVIDCDLTARLARKTIVDNHSIRAGDVVIGLSSFGQAAYEDSFNSGMGSNGLTSARHDIFGKSVAAKYGESYDQGIAENLAYSGRYNMTDASPYPDMDMGKMVLAPTRTYAPILKEILETCQAEVHGLIHCSGGGQTKVLNFLPPGVRVVKDNLFPCPALFKLIAEESGTSWKEMYQVFNMGHRLEVYCSPEIARTIISIADKFAVQAQQIGYVETSVDGHRLLIRNNGSEYAY